MLLTGPWKGAAPGSPYSLNKASSLSRGLVFAYNGHHSLDLVSGTRPTNTSVTEDTFEGKRSWSFIGGVAGNSDLNFGTLTATNDLHEKPATWACVARGTGTQAQLAIGCQADNNVDRGWGFCQGEFGITFVRASTDVRKNISNTYTANTTFTCVVTSDGSGLASGINVYLNGVLGVTNVSTDGVGSTGPASAENLYIGRHRFGSPQSHLGDIGVFLIANRVWTDAEVRAFHKNPYSAFESPPSIVRSLGVPPVGPITGSTSITFGSTSSLTGVAALTGTSAITFGQSGTLSGTGVLAGTSAILFGQSGTISGGAGGMTGTSAITFGQSGTLSGRAALTGTSAITFGQSGTLTGASNITGLSAIAMSATGTIRGVVNITGSSAITFVVSGAFADPEIASAVAPANREVDVIFLQAVNQTAALNTANYSITHGIQVVSVQKITDSWYRLKTSRMTQGILYSISSSNIGPA